MFDNSPQYQNILFWQQELASLKRFAYNYWTHPDSQFLTKRALSTRRKEWRDRYVAASLDYDNFTNLLQSLAAANQTLVEQAPTPEHNDQYLRHYLHSGMDILGGNQRRGTIIFHDTKQNCVRKVYTKPKPNLGYLQIKEQFVDAGIAVTKTLGVPFTGRDGETIVNIDYIEGVNFKTFLHLKPDEDLIAQVTSNLYVEVQKMHDNGLFHGDLNGGNAMIKPNLDTVIIDMEECFASTSRKVLQKESYRDYLWFNHLTQLRQTGYL